MSLLQGGVDCVTNIPAKNKTEEKGTWFQSENEHLKWQARSLKKNEKG